MQDATSEFEAALDGEIVWAPPQLLTGWHGNTPEPAHTQSWGLWQDLLDRNVTDHWTRTTHYTFDAGVQGWVGEGTTAVAQVASPAHDGAGALRATKTMGAGFDSLRFNDANQLPNNLVSSGKTWKVWVLVPAGAAGTEWVAQIEVQDSTFTWQPGPSYPLVPGEWRQIEYTPPGSLLVNKRGIGVQVSAVGVGGSAQVYIDTFTQEKTDPYALWETDTPTLLDVTPGNATISNNVINSTRGARYHVTDSAGNFYIVDWDLTAVVSANVLPASASYSFILRFQDAAADDWIDLWVTVTPGTNEIYYYLYRNYPSTFDVLATGIEIPGLIYTAGKKLGIRMAHVAGLVVVKVWDEDSDDEPVSWMTLVQDIRGTFAGAPHFRTNLSVGNTNGTVIFSLHRWMFKDVRWLGDITTQINGAFGVSHSMDDGLPSAVTSSTGGDPQVSMDAALTGRTVFGQEMDARAYFSPFNTSSPVYGFSRDIASVILNHGLVTADGEERVRIFTGQMTNIVIQGRSATLQAISRTRIKLAQGVLPPIVNGPVQGAELTWLAAYLLWASDVQVAPPVNLDTCQIYIPGAGSMRPFLPYREGGTTYTAFDRPYTFGDLPIRPRFRPGPFVRAIDSLVDRDDGPIMYYPSIGFRHRVDDYGAHYLTQSNPRARMEFWLFGARVWPDTQTLYASPGDGLAYFRLPNGANCAIQLTVHIDRQLHWQMEDFNAPVRRFWTGLTLPADDQWHHIGMYYDISTATFRVHMDGDERTFTPSPAFNVGDLDEVDDGTSWPAFWSAVPYAEIRLHTGTAAQIDPTVVGWDSTQTRTAGTVVATEDWEDTTYAVTWTGNWARDNTQFFAGAWSLKTATIGNMGITAFILTIPGGVTEIGFRVRLSTELEMDALKVYDCLSYHSFGSAGSGGWGTPDIGPAFTVSSGADHSVSGGLGQQALPTTAERYAYVDTGESNGSIVVDVAFGVASATGAPIRIRFRGRGTGNDLNNNYYGQLELDTGGTVRAMLAKVVGGVTTNLTSSTVIGSNGAGSTWRVVLSWSDHTMKMTTANVTTPVAPIMITAKNVYGLTGGDRVYLSATRVTGNTVATTVTYDNLMINGVPVYGGSGAVNAWHLVTIVLRPGVQKLVFRYQKDEVVAGGSDAVWIDDLQLRTASTVATTWEPQGILRGIEFDFEAIIEEGPREAWEWLMSLCQSSMTRMRVDELDRIMILPPGYFIEPEQLTPVDTLTTEWNAQDPDIELDPSKIRNSVQVDFQEAVVDTAPALLLQYKTAFSVLPGKRRYTFSLDVPAVAMVTSITTQTTDIAVGSGAHIWANTMSDGTGTYQPSSQFRAQVVEWDATSAVVEIDNRTSSTLWVTNNFGTDTPFMTLSGYGVHTGQASVSVSAVQPGRPERTVTVTAPELQTRAAARQLAASLLVWTTRPRPGVALRVLGDPRRQPGDLYTLQDPQGTQITGAWRALAVTHARSGAEYVQGIVIQETLPVALWDDGTTGWDEGLWSE